MDGLLRDIRFTLRNIARSPGLATVVAVSLALGIGANTAIFSLMRAILMKTLPVASPEELVLLHWGGDSWPKGLNQSGSGGPSGTAWASSSRSLAFPFFQQIRGSAVLSAAFAFAPLGSERQNTTILADGSAERVDGEMVSGGFFSGLGVAPAAGRAISEDDERSSARVAVLSYRYWSGRFGGDPGIVGRTIAINNVAFVVIGIAPSGFFGVQPGRMPDVWVPMLDIPELVPWGFRPANTSSLLDVRDYWWVHVMARVKPGVDPRQAQTVLDAELQRFVADALPSADPQHPPHVGFEAAAGGLDQMRNTYERPLYVLMTIAGLVLLIACANVAVLLLSRAMVRRREFALRLSLGAARGRLIRQLLTESLLMAVAGGTLGILCAGWTSRALLSLVPVDQRPLVDGAVDPGVFGFAACISGVTALLFGLAPAILATRVDVLPALKQSASSSVTSDNPAHRFWSSTFVVVQVALSLVLLVGATLFMRTLTNLRQQPLGVDGERILVFGVDASQNGYSGDRLLNVYRDLLQRLQSLPGVQSASAARLRLFSG
jgi:macrolide transport system ATP-binding/permease protein